jgi:hypothetical protein
LARELAVGLVTHGYCEPCMADALKEIEVLTAAFSDGEPFNPEVRNVA